MAEDSQKTERRGGIFDASPKSTFIMGILLGVVVCVIVGLVLSLTVLKSNDTNSSNTNGTANTNTNSNTNAAADTSLSVPNLKQYAADLKLDTSKFNKCLDNSEKAAKVAEDEKLGTTAGVQGTPATFVNGYLVSGAIPFEDYTDTNSTTYPGFKKIIDQVLAGKVPSGVDSTTAYKFDIKDTDHIKGSSSAKVTLVVFSDFQCPYCQRHEATLKQILDAYKDQVRIVFYNFPLSFHQYAEKAAEAAECAGDQGKFWEMHDKMFTEAAA